jgi:hypothetical protein
MKRHKYTQMMGGATKKMSRAGVDPVTSRLIFLISLLPGLIFIFIIFHPSIFFYFSSLSNCFPALRVSPHPPGWPSVRQDNDGWNRVIKTRRTDGDVEDGPVEPPPAHVISSDGAATAAAQLSSRQFLLPSAHASLSWQTPP